VTLSISGDTDVHITAIGNTETAEKNAEEFTNTIRDIVSTPGLVSGVTVTTSIQNVEASEAVTKVKLPSNQSTESQSSNNPKTGKDQKKDPTKIVAIIIVIFVAVIAIVFGIMAFSHSTYHPTTMEDSIQFTNIQYTKSCLYFTGLCTYDITGTWENEGQEPYTFTGAVALVDTNYGKSSYERADTITLSPGSSKPDEVLVTVPYSFQFRGVTARAMPANTDDSSDNISATTITTVGISSKVVDPFPYAILLNTPYKLKSEGSSNEISAKITQASILDSYILQKPSAYQNIAPALGKKFVKISVEVNDIAGTDRIYSPKPSDFRLIYNGSDYFPENLEYPVQSAGNNYESIGLERSDETGGSIIYEVPESLTLNNTYIRLMYGNNQNSYPVWKLG
jgi:flagellar basal body-associated protein FliL